MATDKALTGMHSMLVDFQSGRMQIKELIDNLKALFWLEEQTNEEWSNAFFEHWSVLEEGYALSAAAGLPEIDPALASQMMTAVRSLRHEIERRLPAKVNR